jgi:hypothetical protein
LIDSEKKGLAETIKRKYGKDLKRFQYKVDPQNFILSSHKLVNFKVQWKLLLNHFEVCPFEIRTESLKSRDSQTLFVGDPMFAFINLATL